jgi:hypothetical protein
MRPPSLLAAQLATLLVVCPALAWAQQPSAPADDDLVVPSAPPAAPSAATPVAGPPPPGAPLPSPVDPLRELAELRARLEALEAKVTAEPKPTVAQAREPVLTTSTAPTTSFEASPWSRVYPRGLVLGGYVQGQYQQSQASQDQLDANGSTLNQNRFLVRRARLRVDSGWKYTSLTVEMDGNDENGLALGLRRAEASVLLRAPEADRAPLAVATVGLMSIPFGYELYEPNRTRLFLERTTGSRALFPGESDFGASVSGAIGFFRYGVGVFNGTPVPDSVPSAIGFDPTSEKELLARFGAETRPDRDLGVAGGLSFAKGTGFHAGTPATKATVQWQDTNANGVVDPGEIIGVPGQAATTSKTFSRWALGVDLELRANLPMGRGILYGEAYVGSNYDRGLFVADPVASGVNLREVGWYVAYVQEVLRYGLVGLRVDAYNPNGDATLQRAGSLLPLDQTITTWSPLIGVVLQDRARLVFEYDHILNNQGLTAQGVPAAIAEDLWALRLQVEM